MRKPLSITSPDHAVALSLYFIIGVSGVLLTLNKDQGGGRLMALFGGAGLTNIWAVTLAAFGFGAFFASLSARKASRPERSIRVEMWMCIGLFLDLGFFFYAIVSLLGLAGLVTGSFSFAIALGTGLRAIQILVEQRRLRQAREHPLKSDPVLADPRISQDD
jgi:hypothetical protein